jgi:hypothetical protein
LDFKVGVRGWCYQLEEHGLGKGEFDACERLISECRKNGMLPLDICAEDSARMADNLDAEPDEQSPAEFAADQVDYLRRYGHYGYTPIGFWRDLPRYVEMLVEKVDLKSLFARVCEEHHVGLQNARGWSDLNSRAAMMRRFADHEAKGRTPVLLYAGDHDPSGLHISERLRANMEDLADAIGWHPRNLIIERFGLNYDFIEAHGLTWIDGLETGSGGDLADFRHPDHRKPYVQDYLARFGARKVEANALVVRPKAGRELCRQAILRYLPESAVEDYERDTAERQELARREIERFLLRAAR